MNVSLTPELDKFVASKVESGEYATASEVIRDGLRMLKAAEAIRQAKLESLKADIKKGQAGSYHDLDLVLNELEAKYE